MASQGNNDIANKVDATSAEFNDWPFTLHALIADVTKDEDWVTWVIVDISLPSNKDIEWKSKAILFVENAVFVALIRLLDANEAKVTVILIN